MVSAGVTKRSGWSRICGIGMPRWKGGDVGPPGEPGEEQAGDKKEVPAEEQREPEREGRVRPGRISNATVWSAVTGYGPFLD